MSQSEPGKFKRVARSVLKRCTLTYWSTAPRPEASAKAKQPPKVRSLADFAEQRRGERRLRLRGRFNG